MLAELNVKPRTVYLARLRNPHPGLVAQEKEKPNTRNTNRMATATQAVIDNTFDDPGRRPTLVHRRAGFWISLVFLLALFSTRVVPGWNTKILDITSVIIDGRIADITKRVLLKETALSPSFVLNGFSACRDSS